MKETRTHVPVECTEHEIIPFLISYAETSGGASAFWRLPNSSLKHGLVSFSAIEISGDQALEELPVGFMMAPFSKEQSRIYLKADRIFTFENNKTTASADPLEVNSLNWLHENFQPQESTSSSGRSKTLITSVISDDQDSFMKLVSRSVEEIRSGNVEKLVPSRSKKVKLPDGFSVHKAFQKLCDAYPNALITLVSVPGVGTWLGATPELLVQVEAQAVFRTIALAGTQPYQEEINLRDVSWTQKEIEEQALVSRYIINCFKHIRLREFEEHGPRTMVAGNLMHLRTDLSVDLKATNFPTLGSVMLNLLHPTSAVCGMPLNEARAFLAQHEGYDRKFYSGYLGPVNFRDDINLFVNLRCMQLLGNNEAIVYAGAGVTQDSVPEKEWEETELKMNTLLNVIG